MLCLQLTTILQLTTDIRFVSKKCIYHAYIMLSKSYAIHNLNKHLR